MTLTSRAHCLPIPTSVSLKLHTASVSHQRPSTGTSLLHEPRMPRTCKCISRNITRSLLVASLMMWHMGTVKAQRSQNGWMCTVDDFVGYAYDTKQQAWKTATFDIGAKPYPPASGDTKCCSREGMLVLEQIKNITALGGRDDRLSSLVDRVPTALRR